VTRLVITICAPAVRCGAVLVLITLIGAYLTPDLLGGGKTVMAGNLIQNQFTTARDWPFGSAVSLILMAIVLALLFLSMRTQSEDLL
jgi:spermidine/putrescine transport system permease protein